MQIYNLKELADENELSYRDGWIKEFEKFLGDHGYAMVRGVMGGDDRCGAQINADGLAYAEELIDELQNGVGTGDYEVPFTFELAGHDETIADKEGVPITAIPASDRMVSLDHNSETYKGAVGAIDQVITAVSGDNEYGASAPEEKAALVGALRAGRSLLDAVEVKVAAVQATLLPALQYVADNFAKGAVAALGAVAVAAVLTLIGVI